MKSLIYLFALSLAIFLLPISCNNNNDLEEKLSFKDKYSLTTDISYPFLFYSEGDDFKPLYDDMIIFAVRDFHLNNYFENKFPFTEAIDSINFINDHEGIFFKHGSGIPDSTNFTYTIRQNILEITTDDRPYKMEVHADGYVVEICLKLLWVYNRNNPELLDLAGIYDCEEFTYEDSDKIYFDRSVNEEAVKKLMEKANIAGDTVGISIAVMTQ